MKNSWLFLSIFGVFILSSCGSSRYYSNGVNGDPVYGSNIVIRQDRAEVREPQKVVYQEVYEGDDVLLEGETYEMRIRKFDGDIYVSVKDKPWFNNCCWGCGAAFVAGWWGWNRWYDPWYYDPWYGPWRDPWYRPWYRPWYDPWYYPGPGPIIINNNYVYAKKVSTSGSPRSTGNVVSARRSYDSASTSSNVRRSSSSSSRNGSYSSSNSATSRTRSSSYSNGTSRSSSGNSRSVTRSSSSTNRNNSYNNSNSRSNNTYNSRSNGSYSGSSRSSGSYSSGRSGGGFSGGG